MCHDVYASFDEMIAPQTLSQATGVSVTSVRCLPFVGGHSASGNRFVSLETNDGRGPKFVVKRISCEGDWIMRATGDERGREALVWQTGLLERLPPETTHPILALAKDGSGWAILMNDVSSSLISTNSDPHIGDPISEADYERVLAALAALHAAFWNEPQVLDPDRGFCDSWHRYFALSPTVGKREAVGEHPFPYVIRDGWESLPSLMDPAAAQLIGGLADDPGPLCASLARYPLTVVHGDPRPANLGILRTSAHSQPVVLLDWQFVGPGSPGEDLSWYFYCSVARRPISREATIALYRDELARRLGTRFDLDWWQPQIELSLLGNFIRVAWDMARTAVGHEQADVRQRARDDLAWWSERALAATKWL